MIPMILIIRVVQHCHVWAGGLGSILSGVLVGAVLDAAHPAKDRTTDQSGLEA